MDTKKVEAIEFTIAHIFYSVFLVLIFPFVLIRLWFRGVKLPAYRQRWRERFGIFSAPEFNKPVVWLHTVSVGEFITAKPIIDHLLKRADLDLVVTTTTPTASQQVSNSYDEQVFHVYSPYDLKLFVRLFLRRIKPKITVILETELWPNTVDICHKKNIPVLIVNGRLSEKSAQGYRKVSWLFLPMIRKIAHVAAQNETDAKRMQSLGLEHHKTTVTGSIKFDVRITDEMTERAKNLKDKFSIGGKRKIILAASTHKGEEKIVLDAYIKIRQTHPDSLLLLAPRHPDRFNDVFELCRSRNFKLARRSNDASPALDDHILLCDTMGELFFLYGSADIAVVGGSFVNNGGHNYIEAAAWGIPVLSGPSTFNFAQVSQLLIDAEGMKVVSNENELADTVNHLLGNNEERHRRGQSALKVTLKNRGATAKTNAIIDAWLKTDTEHSLTH